MKASVFSTPLLILGAAFIGFAAGAHRENRVPEFGLSKCGVERWAVKTLSDPAAGSVNLTPVRTNIPVLDAPSAPSLPSDNTTRLAEEEQVFSLRGTMLVAFKLEGDSDIHLVLKNTTTGQTMIAEIPDPSCVASDSARAPIAAARTAFVNAFGQPTGSFQTSNQRITLTGVRFYDFLHGQTGVAPNGVELHPVLAFRKGT